MTGAVVMACTCGRIVLGSEAADARNWNPDCPEHGTESVWWNSDAQAALEAFAGRYLGGGSL